MNRLATPLLAALLAAPLACWIERIDVSGDDAADTARDAPEDAETTDGASPRCGDGRLEPGEECEPGGSAACPTACGSLGEGTCGPDCRWVACVPPAEVCNGRDDDCDEVADDPFACAAGAERSCSSGPCDGLQRCEAPGCTWGGCVLEPPPGNDTCSPDAPDVSAGGDFSGSLCGAEGEHAASCAGRPSAGPDVYFRLDLVARSLVVLDTSGSRADADLFLYPGPDCPAAAPLACDDASAGGGQARVSTPLEPGPYWIVLDAPSPAGRGTFQLHVSIAPL